MSDTSETPLLDNGMEESTTVEAEEQNAKVINKKKRKIEHEAPITHLAEVFLRVMYPISTCMSKCLSAGLVKSLGYLPTVILHHGAKSVQFSETAWDSFVKHLHLIECYLANNIIGRKTNVRLLDSDIEIDVVKQRGDLQVRIRNLSKHEDKLQLTQQEFFILNAIASPVTRYVKQLAFSEPILQDYLIHTMETQPDVPILYSPIDTSIFNRIPYEVEVWRGLRDYISLPDKQDPQNEHMYSKENLSE